MRALHELGRDDEALEVLRAALSESFSKGDASCFVGIPWHAEREAGDLARQGAQSVFEARCFAVVTELAPENADAWKWRGTIGPRAGRIAALEHVVAQCTEAETRKNEDGEPAHEEWELEVFADRKREAVSALEEARAEAG